MQTLQRIQELCGSISAQISGELEKSPKVNKAEQARIRANLNELKKIITPAKQESIELCK